MTIAFACDHAGFPFREDILRYLATTQHKILDLWPEKNDELDDFPDYVAKVCSVIWRDADIGILVCGTGVGMSIAANRYRNIRAVLAYSPDVTKVSRSHNDANVICFGARTMKLEDILESIGIFLTEPFLGGKYQKRNDKIGNICCL